MYEEKNKRNYRPGIYYALGIILALVCLLVCFACWLPRWYVHRVTHQFLPSFIPSLVCSYIHLFIDHFNLIFIFAFIHSFILFAILFTTFVHLFHFLQGLLIGPSSKKPILWLSFLLGNHLVFCNVFSICYSFVSSYFQNCESINCILHQRFDNIHL